MQTECHGSCESKNAGREGVRLGVRAKASEYRGFRRLSCQGALAVPDLNHYLVAPASGPVPVLLES